MNHHDWSKAWACMKGGFEVFSPSLKLVLRYDSEMDVFLFRGHTNPNSEWSQVVPFVKHYDADDWLLLHLLEKPKANAT